MTTPDDPLAELDRLLQLADEQLDEGNLEGAVGHLEQAMALDVDSADAHLMTAELMLELGDPDNALEILEAAARRAPTDPDVVTARAIIEVHLGRYAEARSALEAVLADVPDHADACFWLSVVIERDGDDDAADQLLARAAELDPERYHLPYRIERDAFEAELVGIIESLPAPVAKAADEVPILVHDLPTDELLAGDGDRLPPDLLGLFVGANQQELSVLDGNPPLRVVYLFQRNIERVARNREELVEEARVTLVHEVGHYLGLEEDELHELGLG